MKKIVALLLALTLVLGLAACAGESDTTTTDNSTTTDTTNTTDTTDTTDTAMSGAITVISREEGSGTRGAFVELMGVETDEGDMTTVDAEIANSTSLVQSTVAGNKNAIGYISLGS